jgi:acyl carrier protein
MNVKDEVLRMLDDVLGLNGRAMTFSDSTPLLGSVPELDSMAVTSLLTAIEERFGFTIDDDEIDGSTFATVGSLVELVSAKVTA